MLKKSVTYKNFNNEVVTEDFYFHMTKTEAVELEVNLPGGLAAYARLVGANAKTNPGALIDLFKKIVRISYGVRSEDGKYFRKSDQAWNDFVDCGAYSVFFLDLIGNSASLADFINAAIGESLSEDGKKITAADIETKVQEISNEPTPFKTKDNANHYTPEELASLTDAQWGQVARRFKGQMPKFMIAEGMRRMGVASPAATQVVETPEVDMRPIWERENRRLTREELASLSDHDFEQYQLWLPTYKA